MPKATTEKTMPTESTAITVTSPASSSLVTLDAELAAELSELDDAQYQQVSKVSLPSAIFLNQEKSPNHGLWIEANALTQAGWMGQKAEDEHQFGGSTTPAKGIRLHQARIQVVAKSPRFIEVKKKNGWTDPLTGATYQEKERVGIYDTSEGQALYARMNPPADPGQEAKRNASLRTIFLVYLLDNNNNWLHAKPFSLSLHGTAALKFDMAWTQFCMEMDNVRAKLLGQAPNPFGQKSFDVTARYVFDVQFEAGLEGKAGLQSNITRPKDYTHPSEENFLSLYLRGPEWTNRIQSLVKGANYLFDSYLSQIAKYGYVGVTTADAPTQVQIEVLPDTGEDLE